MKIMSPYAELYLAGENWRVFKSTGIPSKSWDIFWYVSKRKKELTRKIWNSSISLSSKIAIKTCLEVLLEKKESMSEGIRKC